MENKKSLNLDIGSCSKLDALFREKHYESLSVPLYMLCNYVLHSFDGVETELAAGNLSEEREKELLGMIKTMERKFTHMLQTIEVACNLASVKRYEPYQEIANILVATFHDIGRSAEILKVGTQMGLNKANHCELGVRILFSEDRSTELLRSYINPDLYNIYRDAIYAGVKYHGSKDVPYDEMSPFISTTVKDIRDADKVAIISSYTDPETDMDSVFHMSFEELAQIPIADLSVEEIMNHQQINRGDKSVPYDRLRQFISHIGFIFDINSPIVYDYLYYSNWVQAYVAHVKYFMSGENYDKMCRIEEEAIKFLHDHSLKNPEAIKIGYSRNRKKDN